MGLQAAEHVLRSSRFGPSLRLRLDLHGVSVFGPEGERTLIRWEWVEQIEVGDGVDVRSATARLTLPPGAFMVPPETLADLLQQARSIEGRADVIERLGARRTPPG